MMKLRTILFVASLAAAGGAWWTTSRELFVRVGCGVFWFTLVGLFLLLSKRGTSGSAQHVDVESVDPNFDSVGTHRFQGDVLDVRDHPYPGRNARI